MGYDLKESLNFIEATLVVKCLISNTHLQDLYGDPRPGTGSKKS